MSTKRKADEWTVLESPSKKGGKSKKLKFDENDIDYMIGDLDKAEAQLVLTRLIKSTPELEASIRRQIQLIQHARSKVSQVHLKKQLKQMKELHKLMTSLPAPAWGPPGAGGAFSHGAGFQAPVQNQALLRAVKNRIRNAFVKIGGRHGADRYRVDIDVVEGEAGKASDRILRGKLGEALPILEAITEELVDRGSQLGERSVSDFLPALQRVAGHWVDAFLSEPIPAADNDKASGDGDGDGEEEDSDSDDDGPAAAAATGPGSLSAEQREMWFEKLRSWDSSAAEDGTFAAARWAAKLGWSTPAMKQVLCGDAAAAIAAAAQATAQAAAAGEAAPPPPADLFHEPPGLTSARLQVLERRKRYQAAVHLCRATGNASAAPKYLMKLGRAEEAAADALALRDSAEVFAIATVARPISAASAFKLAIHALAVEPQWSSEAAERATWLIDLAAAEGMLDALVTDAAAAVSHKGVLFELCRLLAGKGHHCEASQLGQRVITPFPLPKLAAMYDAAAAEKKRVGMFITEEAPTTVTALLAALPHACVPPHAPRWLWETEYDTAMEERRSAAATSAAAAAAATDGSSGGGSDVTTEEEVFQWRQQCEQSALPVLPVILASASACAVPLKQLLSLMDAMRPRCAYASLQQLGAAVVRLADTQEAVHDAYREEMAREKFLLERAPVEPGLPPPQFQPRPVDHPVDRFGARRMAACRAMLSAALEHKARYARPDAPPPAATPTAAAAAAAAATDMEVEGGAASAAEAEAEASRVASRAACCEVVGGVVDLSISRLPSPSDLLKLVKDIVAQHEYRLAIRICTKAFQQTEALSQRFTERQAWQTTLGELQRERTALQQQGVSLAPDKAATLQELELKYVLLALLPSHETEASSPAHFSRLRLRVATAALGAALASRSAVMGGEQAEEQRLPAADCMAVLEEAIGYLQSPKCLRDLARCAANAATSFTVAPSLDPRAAVTAAAAAAFGTAAGALSDTASLVRPGENFGETERQLTAVAARAGLSRTAQLRQALAARQRLQTELDVIAQDFVDGEVADADVERVTELRTALQQLPPTEAYELNSVDAYDSLDAELLQLMLSAAVATQRRAEAAVDAPHSLEDCTLRATLRAEADAAEAALQKVFTSCLEALSDDALSSHTALMDSLTAAGRPFLAARTAKHAIRCCAALEEGRESREDTVADLAEVEAEVSELVSAHQPVPQDRSDTLRSLRLQTALWRLHGSATHGRGADWYDSQALRCGKSCVQALLSRRSALTQQLLALSGRDAAAEALVGLEDTSSAQAQAAMEAARRQQAAAVAAAEGSVEEVTGEVESLVRWLGEELRVPASLRQLGLLLSKVEGVVMSQLVLFLAQQVCAQVSRLRSQYVARATPTEQLMKLEQREAEVKAQTEALAALGRSAGRSAGRSGSSKSRGPPSLSSEEGEKLKSLRRVQLLWGRGPEHTNLDSGALDEQSKKAVNLALRDCAQRLQVCRGAQDAVEDEDGGAPEESAAELARLRDEEEALLPVLQASVALAVEHVASPAFLLSLLSSGPLHALPLPCVQLGDHMATVMAQQQAQWDQRRPLLLELRALQTLQSELATVSKSLKAEDEQRMGELTHQVFHWDRESPYTRETWQQRDSYTKQFARSMLSTLLARKQALSARANALMDVLEQRARVRHGLAPREEGFGGGDDSASFVTITSSFDARMGRLALATQPTGAADGDGDGDGGDGGAKSAEEEAMEGCVQSLRAQLQEVDEELAGCVDTLLTRVTDPATLQQMGTQLKNSNEHALAIKTCEHALSYVTQLDQARQESATVQCTLYLLRKEKQQAEADKGSNKTLTADRAALLAQAEAATAELPELRYVGGGAKQAAASSGRGRSSASAGAFSFGFGSSSSSSAFGSSSSSRGGYRRYEEDEDEEDYEEEESEESESDEEYGYNRGYSYKKKKASSSHSRFGQSSSSSSAFAVPASPKRQPSLGGPSASVSAAAAPGAYAGCDLSAYALDGVTPVDGSAPFRGTGLHSQLSAFAALAVTAALNAHDAAQAQADAASHGGGGGDTDSQDFEMVEAEGAGTAADAAAALAAAVAEVKRVVDLCVPCVGDPTSLKSSILNKLASRGQRDLTLDVAAVTMEKLSALRTEAEERYADALEHSKLQQERRQLQGIRRDLPEEDATRLAELSLARGVLLAQPAWQRRSVSQYDSAASSIARDVAQQLLTHAAEQEQRLQTELALQRSDSITSASAEEAAAEAKRESLTDALARVVELCEQHCHDVEELASVVTAFNSFQRFSEVIQLGMSCQAKVCQLLAIQEEYAALQRRQQELQMQQVPKASASSKAVKKKAVKKKGKAGKKEAAAASSSAGSRAEVAAELETVTARLEELQPLLKLSPQRLRQLALQLATYIIDASRVEQQTDIVRRQAVLVFKMTLSADKFEEARSLVPEGEWEAVRTDLLQYLAAHDPSLPGSPTTPRAQIELLLQEGLWDEAISKCPPPADSSGFGNNNIEMLELLWFEVERQAAEQLERLLPLIEAYARKEFQAFAFLSGFDRMLDSVQEHYPDFIVDMFKAGSEILESNMAARQYAKYCEFLKLVKQRLCENGQADEWGDFIAEVRSNNKRKKKLLQIMNVEDL